MKGGEAYIISKMTKKEGDASDYSLFMHKEKNIKFSKSKREKESYTMKKMNLKKLTAMVMAVCAMSAAAFAAEPAFDSPQEEATFWAQQQEKDAWMEAHTNNVAVENPHYYVIAKPFDTPEQEAVFWAQRQQKNAWMEAHTNNTAVENSHYYVIAKPFDTPQEEYDFYHK